MKYFLVGYMASGKTRQGKLMAEKDDLTYFDLDEYIVLNEGRSVTEIFKVDGEQKFRELESYYLHYLCEHLDSFILSTGGGTPCHNDNMDYMNNQGHTIFLNTPITVITERLIKNRAKRPLVKDLSDEEIRDFVKEQLEIRLPYYTKAKESIIPEIIKKRW